MGCEAPCEEKCRLCEVGDGIAIRDVEADFGACERDALYRETLKRFGLTVLTPKARTYLDVAFSRK